MTAVKHRTALVLLGATTLVSDRITKHVAVTSIAHEPARSYLSDVVRLQYAENTGVFLSLGANLPPAVRTAAFTVGVGILLILTMVAAVRLQWGKRALAGLSLVFAGGVSNLVDRVTRGSVVDFVNVGVGPVRTGIFNVADVAITIGVILLALTYAGTEQAHPPRAEQDVTGECT